MDRGKTEGENPTLNSDAAAIPIFAMSANVFTDYVEKSLAAGMNGHIAKPFDGNLLIQKLQEL